MTRHRKITSIADIFWNLDENTQKMVEHTWHKKKMDFDEKTRQALQKLIDYHRDFEREMRERYGEEWWTGYGERRDEFNNIFKKRNRPTDEEVQKQEA